MMTNAEQFFSNLMNPVKEIREKAEKEMDKMREVSFSISFPIFQAGMTSTNKNIAQLSTLLFKKTYLDNGSIKAILPPNIIEQMKLFLKSLLCFDSNAEWKMLKRIAEPLAQLYQISDLKTNFKEIICWFTNKEPMGRRFAMYLIEVLIELDELKDEIISGSIEEMKQMFIQGFKDDNNDVRESTFKAASQFLINLKDKEVLLSFVSLGDIMLETVSISLGHKEESDKSILELLNHLTESHPLFWRERIESLIAIVCKIASNQRLSSSVRELSLEIVYSIAKSSPALLRKSYQFKECFVPLMFRLLCEIDNVDSNDNWEKLLIEDENDLDNMHYLIKRGFDRLSLCLDGKNFMVMIEAYITTYLKSNNWIEINGAFTALAAMGEGCQEVYKANLIELLNHISVGLSHSHLRVRYSALVALGAILNQTSPIPQKKYCNNIIQGLIILMTDKEPSLKVKTRACCSLLDFLNGLLIKNKDYVENEALLLPYSADLVKLLLSLFEMSLSLNYPPLQEYSLNNISIIANLLDKAFLPYYDQIMPGLKILFYNLDPTTSQIKKLRGHCIETIAYLLAGISENISKYLHDLNELSSAFAESLKILPEEDPQLPAILNAFTHISLLMEDKFLPYLQFLFPIMEKYITADIGFKLEDSDDKEFIPEDITDETEKAKIGSVQVTVGTKAITLSVNTFALQTKLLGLTILNEICLNMGKNFLPFTEKFLLLSKDLLKFPYSRKLRKVAVRSMSSCMNCCTEDSDKGKILNYFGSELLGVFNYNIASGYFREIKTYLKTLNECVSLIQDKSVFNDHFIIQLYTLLSEAFRKIFLKIIEVKEMISKNERFDDNDENNQHMDLQKLNKLIHNITELSGRLFKIFGEQLTSKVKDNLYDSFLTLWINGIIDQTKFPSICEEEILSAASFFDDFLEYSEINAFKTAYLSYIDLSLKINSKNEEILQSIIYGYGLISKRASKEVFQNNRELIYNSIIKIIERPLNDSNEKTYDNGIGALGKFVYYQTACDQNGIMLAQRFIKLIPLEHDLFEGRSVAIEFCRQIVQNHPLLINEVNTQFTRQALINIIQFNKQNQFLEEDQCELIKPATQLNIN